MQNLMHMSENSVSSFECESCGRVLKSEVAFIQHVCRLRQRTRDLETVSGRMAYECFLDFYRHQMPQASVKSAAEFIRSSYYAAFYRFAEYCRGTRVLNVREYQRHLLRNRVRIDSWCSDLQYAEFLRDYLRRENEFDALSRSIETVLDLAAAAELGAADYLRHHNLNRLCQEIVAGRVSAWLLYNCDSGREAVHRLDTVQLDMVWPYIEPDAWNLRFRRDAAVLAEIQSMLKQGGF